MTKPIDANTASLREPEFKDKLVAILRMMNPMSSYNAQIKWQTDQILALFASIVPEKKELAPNGRSERIGFNEAIDLINKRIGK